MTNDVNLLKIQIVLMREGMDVDTAERVAKEVMELVPVINIPVAPDIYPQQPLSPTCPQYPQYPPYPTYPIITYYTTNGAEANHTNIPTREGTADNVD